MRNLTKTSTKEEGGLSLAQVESSVALVASEIEELHNEISSTKKS